MTHKNSSLAKKADSLMDSNTGLDLSCFYICFGEIEEREEADIIQCEWVHWEE